MGTRGPAPKPTALRLLEGDRSHRPVNHREPQPLVSAPDMPPYLNKDAKKEWRRLVPILLQMRVLTTADGVQLANLCVAYATLLRAQQQLDKSGLLIKTPGGFVQQNPLLKIVSIQMEIIGRISREFGLSPASRTRLQAMGETGYDAIEEQMFG